MKREQRFSWRTQEYSMLLLSSPTLLQRGRPRRLSASQEFSYMRLRLTKKTVARVTWIVQSGMIMAEASWLAIVHVIQPSAGSVLERVPQYLRMLGGNSRFTFPIGLIALAADLVLKETTIHKRTALAWTIIAVAAFGVLWLVGAVVIVILAFVFSWH